MRYISEIKLTELVKNFVEDLNRTRDLKEKKNKIFSLLSYFETPYCEEIERQKKLAEDFSNENETLKQQISDLIDRQEKNLSFIDSLLIKSIVEENQQLKKILRDIRNINSHGNMEYFGEAVMEILNNTNKSLWYE